MPFFGPQGKVAALTQMFRRKDKRNNKNIMENHNKGEEESEFDKFLNDLSVKLSRDIPGLVETYAMGTNGRVSEETVLKLRKFLFREISDKDKEIRRSAVLILLYPKNGVPHFVITERSSYDGKYSGDICLPGGKEEKSDKSLAETALRETFEEIGIDPKLIKIMSETSSIRLYSPKLTATGFIGYTRTDISTMFKADPKEVARIYEIPVGDILDESLLTVTPYELPGTGAVVENPIIRLREDRKKKIWGITGLFVLQLRGLILAKLE